MNSKKIVAMGIVVFAALMTSELIFSEAKGPSTLNPQKASGVPSVLKSDEALVTPLTLDQAKAKGLITHTYPRQHNALVGEDGIKYLAFDTGKGYQLFIVAKNKKIAAKDGAYKLKDGGEVRVKSGLIVWSNAVINTRFPNPGYTSGVIGLG